jgi:hypothetical protein
VGGSGRIGAVAVAALLALAFPACGSDDDSGAGGERNAGSGGSGSAPPAETADRPAKLPDGWKREVNRPAGFSVGRPPGWEGHGTQGQGTLLRSPDNLAVVTITADRTAGALELPLGRFARRTAAALGTEVAGRARFRDLKLERSKRLAHRYDAARVEARGRSGSARAPEERITVAVIRRPELAAYVLVARENAERRSDFVGPRTITEIARSLRGRPPG